VCSEAQFVHRTDGGWIRLRPDHSPSARADTLDQFVSQRAKVAPFAEAPSPRAESAAGDFLQSKNSQFVCVYVSKAQSVCGTSGT